MRGQWSYTVEAVATVQRLYRSVPAPDLAVRLFGTRGAVKAVYRLADALGLVRPKFRRTAAGERFLRAKHAAGWSDTEIADALGCGDRHTVSDWRASLGLPPLFGVKGAPWTPRKRGQAAVRTRRQLEAAGLPSIGHLRARAHARLAASYGLPESVRPRGVQVVLALVDGPLTRRQIVESLGLAWKPGNGGRNNLASNDPEGSYLAHLQALGLVLRVRRTGSGRRGNQLPSLYMLTAAALDALAAAGTKEGADAGRDGRDDVGRGSGGAVRRPPGRGPRAAGGDGGGRPGKRR